MIGTHLDTSRRPAGPMIVMGMTGPEPEALLRSLGLDLHAADTQICQTPADLMAALGPAPLPGRDILALVTSCRAFLAGSMAAGLSPAQAGKAWLRAATDFNRMCREFGTPTLVLDRQCACAAPCSVRHAVMERFGRLLAGHDAPAVDSAVPPILLLLAEDVMQRNVALRRAQAKLETSIHPLEGAVVHSVPDAEAVIQEMHTAQDMMSQLRADAIARTQEAETLQRALEAAEERIAQIIEASAVTLCNVQQDLDSARQSHAAAEIRWKATIEPLHAEFAATLADLQAARQEVADLRSSTSWRITGPLRQVRRLMSPARYRAQ